MNLSVVVSIHNRHTHFRRGLWTLFNQSWSKINYEVIVIDDRSTPDLIRSVMEEYIGRMNMTYIRIEPTKENFDIPVDYHTPALSNNIGIRRAQGRQIMITEPGILHAPRNLERAAEYAPLKKNVFGYVYHSHPSFVTFLEGVTKTSFRDTTYGDWLKMPGATHISPLGPYWFIGIFDTETARKIGGVDEEYLRGVAAEDDDFKIRMERCGFQSIVSDRILGIHQDHSNEGETDERQNRDGDLWMEGLKHNRLRFADLHKNPSRIVANEGREWGAESVIVEEKNWKFGASR